MNTLAAARVQKKKLGKGFADAATLANWTINHPIDLEYAAYVPSCFFTFKPIGLIFNLFFFYVYRYKHYLRPEDEKLAKKVWDLVQKNNATTALYHFTVRCSAGGADCPSGRYVLISLVPSIFRPYYNSSYHPPILFSPFP